MEGKSRKMVIKHDTSVSTGRSKDKVLQKTHERLQMMCGVNQLNVLKSKKKRVCCGRKKKSKEGLSYSLSEAPNI
jgi:hypothetical protein